MLRDVYKNSTIEKRIVRKDLNNRGMMKKNKLASGFALVVGILLFTACGYTKEEKEQIKEYKTTAQENAVAYIEGKYGFTPVVKSVDCETRYDTVGSLVIPDFSPRATGDVYLQMEYEGKEFDTYITGKEASTEGYDNYQTEIIEEAIITKMQELLGTTVKKGALVLGVFDTHKVEHKYGLLHVYYDGTNLKEVLESAKQNHAVIHYVQGDTESLQDVDLTELFGENMSYLFINYRDEAAFELQDDFYYNITGSPIDSKVDYDALMIADYMTAEGERKEYHLHEIQKQGDFYYMMEEGTYCNFTETDTFSPEAFWKGRGFTNPKQIYDAYLIDTDASEVMVWIAKEDLKGSIEDGVDIVTEYIYGDNARYSYSYGRTRESGQGKYICVGIDMRNRRRMKISVFTDRNDK